ncbi:S8 family serine peptidase [Pedobacter sp. SD-b]|uniref:S8 family serine peptidase n=1 Tax=Pedobacter segetis TaxID=2793069 RepID=A0ABS1BK78_9SPHI|nr:S8 family serine peptidase [Pedobacter segetis]MBK0383294.1 S8 family serine peptidase [Pedobacter segetis]
MIRKSLFLPFFLLCFSFSFAQESGNLLSDVQINKLQRLSSQFKETSDENRSRAFALAAKNNWVTLRVQKDGTIISLQGIDALGLPLYLKTENNTVAAGTTRTNSFYSGGSLGLNLNGSSDNLIGKIGIWDGGTILTSHQEFQDASGTSRIILKDTPSSGSQHATHVAGTMIAAGINPIARGMAWGLKKLYAWDFNSDIPEMTTAASQSMIISNHSYGFIAGWNYNSSTNPPRWEWYGSPNATEDYKFGFYDDSARDWDKICYNAPYYLPIKSAGNNRSENGPSIGTDYYGFDSSGALVIKGPRPSGISNNDGYDIISTTGTAKNILSIGAVYGLPFGAGSTSDIKISPFSSWGPTDDGRIKPDIVADGVELTSTSNENNMAYATLSGTSMSSPNTSGSLTLLQEYYSKLNNGSFMRSATLKSLVINTTDEAGASPGPDYIYGWGLLNVERAANLIKLNGTKSLISERTLSQGEVYNLQVTTSGYGPFKVTICWTDPEGIPNATGTLNNRTPKLVNDLDLRIIKGANTFLPWKLDPNNPSNAAVMADNIIDNVEQIAVSNALPGQVYTIRVSHKGTLAKGPQAYSIIASGVGGNVYCASAALSTVDSRIDKVVFNTISNTLNNTCRDYSDFKSISTGLEQGKAYPFTISLGSCGTAQNKFAKVFIDWNGNGNFDDSGETVATSGLIAGNGDFTGNIAVPANVVPGNTTVMRIVTSEVSSADQVLSCGNYAKGETQDYTINFIKPTNDVGVIAFNDFQANVCKSNDLIFSVKIKNFGSNTVTNIPITLTLTNNSTIVKKITEVYTGSLAPNFEADFKVSGGFMVTEGLTYTLEGKTELVGDVISTNNATINNFNVIIPMGIKNASIAECDNAKGFYQLNSEADGTVFWYTNANDTVPLTFGNVFINTLPSNKTLYAGVNDFKSYFGAANKKIYGGGNYSGNFGPKPIITVKAPMVLDSALLYISQSGQLTFTVETANGEVLNSSTINVERTKTTPDVINSNTTIDDDLNDLGKVYKIGLVFPAAGKYYVGIQFNGATIFRSNVGVNNIPIDLGNGLVNLSGAYSDTNGIITNAYYYFYNMLFKSLGCTNGKRTAITLAKPTITQNGTSLVASYGLKYKWYVNDTIDSTALTNTYNPKKSGVYRVELISPSGCVTSSSDFNYVLSAIKPYDAAEIALNIYPIPTKGILNIFFDVIKKENISIKIINIIGQEMLTKKIDGFSGKFDQGLDLRGFDNGTYIFSLKVGNKVYKQKFILSK